MTYAGDARPLPTHPRVAAVGDSVIGGYGVGGNSYAQILAQRLNASRTMFYARSTFTVADAVRMLPRIEKFEPDLVLVNVGGSDGLVHAGRTIEQLLTRFAPKSWQGVGGLEVDLSQSARQRARLRERLTTAIKLVLKHIGVRLTGGFRRVTPQEFEPMFVELMTALSRLNAQVIVIGLHSADERLWPRSRASGLEYELITLRVLRSHDALFFDPKPVLHQWSDFLADHAHFNEAGHRKVADLLWAGLTDEFGGSGQSRPDGALPGSV